MDSLGEETWDLVIAGTSLPQSLLALSLSRSDLKILHVDKNQYYGGADAGLSIDEAERWMNQQQHSPTSSTARVVRSSNTEKLAASRAYTLSLNPQIIYASSAFLPSIVTSQLHGQLDFLAVGSWWMLQDDRLQKIPSTREDVFADEGLSQRDKFKLMKFLRYVIQGGEASEKNSLDIADDVALAEALTYRFRIPPSLQGPIAALALANGTTDSIQFSRTVSRIRRHMMSMDHFGPGFAAVYPKYAGNAELSQVACRAGAVGGAVYLLGQGIVSVNQPMDVSQPIEVQLTNGTKIQTKMVVGGTQDVPSDGKSLLEQNVNATENEAKQLNCISIVSDPLSHLFPQTSDNGPIPAIAIVCVNDAVSSSEGLIYLQIHSEDTGECPPGQCCIYGSVLIRDGNYESAAQRLRSAIEAVLSARVTTSSSDEESTQQVPEVLWSMTYSTQGPGANASLAAHLSTATSENVLIFPQRGSDIAFDDSVLDSVRAIWRKVIGDEAKDDEFLVFQSRTENDDQ